jgi:hypothetical protein
VADESSSAWRDGDQDGVLCTAIASICRTADRTIRREYLDQTLFWTAADLETKLLEFKNYYNEHRAHAASAGRHLAIVASPFVRICNFIGGENTVTRYFRHPSRRELEFATDRLTEASTLIFCPCYRSLYDECFCRCARMEFWRKTQSGLKPQLVLRSPSSHVICLESPATEYSTFAFRVFWNSSSVSPRIAA